MRTQITITRLSVHPLRWTRARGRGAPAAYVAVDPMGIRLKEGET